MLIPAVMAQHVDVSMIALDLHRHILLIHACNFDKVLLIQPDCSLQAWGQMFAMLSVVDIAAGTLQ